MHLYIYTDGSGGEKSCCVHQTRCDSVAGRGILFISLGTTATATTATATAIQ